MAHKDDVILIQRHLKKFVTTKDIQDLKDATLPVVAMFKI